ncbi:MAG: 50S ribosomal protein L17 [Bacteroidetes bacterium]|nr:50S ribosomal protein L17 [Bacteroidota bacterium]
MRHGVKGRKLNRTASHRVATFRNLATALLRYKKIKTTTAKAKELRVFVEPLITKAKDDSVASRRLVARHIKDKEVLKELFTEIIEKVGDRAGGYTRVVKLGRRYGDAAEMSLIELVDFNDIINTEMKAKSAEKKAKKEAKVAAEEAKAAAEVDEIEDAQVVEETTEQVVEETTEASEVKAEETKTDETDEAEEEKKN